MIFISRIGKHFGNPRKAVTLLKLTLQRLAASGQDLTLCILGSDQPYASLELPFPGVCLGHVSEDDRLAVAYSAADVFVAPSREDNLPNTVLESLACGTPCVAFDIGGMPDMIRDAETGYLAKAFSTESLANAIQKCLSVEDGSMNRRARETAVRDYPLVQQASKYRQLFEELLEQRMNNWVDGPHQGVIVFSRFVQRC